MIWTLVSLSSAPVGSSAKTISGLLTKALAIATRCICPPDIWFGFLRYKPAKPTLSRASLALLTLSSFGMPEIVNANSTFLKIVW